MPQRLTDPTPAPRPPRPRAGATLVEVLAVIVILALVGGTVTGVLTRQQRFYRDATETVEVRRELRGTASLLPTDLRAISSVGQDIRTALPGEFVVRAAIGSGVVCARPGATQLDLVPLVLSNHTLTDWHDRPLSGDDAFVFDEGTNTGATDDTWWPGVVTQVNETMATCLTTPFGHTVSDAAQPRLRVTFTTAVPATVEVGTVVRFTRQVRYRFYQPTGSANWYLGYAERRLSAWGDDQPVAGPLTATSGLRFTYFDTLGAAIAPTTDSLRRSVARIDVQVRAMGRSDALRTRGGAAYQDSLLFRIGVRNFR